MVLWDISQPFGRLFPTQGQIAQVLLTRLPLILAIRCQNPLDLHVLSTPPAFVLSQDQTLQQKLWKKCPSNKQSVAKGNPNPSPKGQTQAITNWHWLI